MQGRYGAVLTHGSLAILMAGMFAMILRWPAWMVLLPCILVHHRVGILLHEYVHGIPFRRYRHNLLLLSLCDGALLSFGMLEVFRASHLAHHRWLNTELDPAMQAQRDKGATRSVLLRALLALELPQHAKYLFGYLRGERPYVKRWLILAGVVQSIMWIGFWIALGEARVVGLLVILNLTTSVASSVRGAVEHHNQPGDVRDTNEYRALIPLFNLNRHIDHHRHPARPWYLLRFVSPAPFPAHCYWTHWYHAYIKRDYCLMPPRAGSLDPAPAVDKPYSGSA